MKRKRKQGKKTPSKGSINLNVANYVGCFLSAVSKIWSKYKQNGKVLKRKHTG